MEFQYHISEMAAETAAADFVKEFVQVEKFLSACQQCPNYNTRWTCPPFDFDPMTIWSGYTTLRLYARILHADGADQPLDGALAALKREKRLYREKLYRWEQAEPGSQDAAGGHPATSVTGAKRRRSSLPPAGSTCATPSRRWAAMWRAACGGISTCPFCGAGTAKRRSIWCW